MSTLEQLDAQILQWQNNIAAADANVAKLKSEQHSTILLLAGDSGKQVPPLKTTGVTKKRVDEAIAALNDIDNFMPLVSGVVYKAETKRQNEMPHFFQETKIKEILDLLNGESITLQVVPTSLEETGLLSSAATTRKVTPKSLLDAMVNSFVKARDSIAAVSKAWDQLEPFVDQAEKELDQLEKDCAGKLGARVDGKSVSEWIASGRKQVSDWKVSWKTDPLGTQVSVNAITQIRNKLDAADQERRSADSELLAAREKLAELRAQGADANKIVSLDNWLNQIQVQYNSGEFGRVKTSLESWRKTANDQGRSTSSPSRPASPSSPQTPGTYHPGSTRPVDRTQVRIEPGSAQKREKSDLEKLVDGEVDSGPRPATAPPAEAPPDPVLEKMLGAPSTKKPDAPSTVDAALGAIEKGPARPAQTKPEGKPADSNPALEGLLSGGTKPGGNTGAAKTGDPKKDSPNPGLGALIEGKGKPAPSGNVSPAATPDKGKPQAKPTQPQSGSADKSKLDDLFKN